MPDRGPRISAEGCTSSKGPGTKDESTVELREVTRNAPSREDGSRTTTEIGRVYAGQIVSVLHGADGW